MCDRSKKQASSGKKQAPAAETNSLLFRVNDKWHEGGREGFFASSHSIALRRPCRRLCTATEVASVVIVIVCVIVEIPETFVPLYIPRASFGRAFL